MPDSVPVEHVCGRDGRGRHWYHECACGLTQLDEWAPDDQ
jgi:hypothetical protein